MSWFEVAAGVPAVLQVRKPTNVVSTICDDRGEEPTYAGELLDQQGIRTHKHTTSRVVHVLDRAQSSPRE